jgi:hypothetical protein
LAAAGFNAVAPDMRGYGQTDRPELLDQYTLLHLVGDMVGLVDALGDETAVIHILQLMRIRRATFSWYPGRWHDGKLRKSDFTTPMAQCSRYRGLRRASGD